LRQIALNIRIRQMKRVIISLVAIALGFGAVGLGSVMRGWGNADPNIYTNWAPTFIVIVLTLAIVVGALLWVMATGDLLRIMVADMYDDEVAVIAGISYIFFCFLFGHFAMPESLNPATWQTPWFLLPFFGFVSLMLVFIDVLEEAVHS
jgi:hypothetical protein